MPSADLEHSSSLANMNHMPWGWVLEYLLDVKQLSPLFFKDFIGYFPQVEQPQCSKLVQKLVLRYLDEVALTRELDACDALLVRCFLKEQGVSNLRSTIHSLKESFAHDLALRVETEAVLTNLRSYCKEGRRDDLAAYEDAVDKLFSEDILGPRGVERRNELTAVFPDRLNDESGKDLREQLLTKYSLEELCGDLARYVDDKKKPFEIKFLDQLAKDVENGVYISSPGSDLPETQTPSKMHVDFCDKLQLQGSLSTGKERPVRKTSVYPSSDWPTISRPSKENGVSCKGEAGDSDPHNGVSGVKVSEPKDGIAEISDIANGLTNDMRELVNDITSLTENVDNATNIPFSPPNLCNQQTSSLSAPVAANPVSTQETFIAVCPAKRATVDLGIGKPVEDRRENMGSTEHDTIESLKNGREGDILLQPTSASTAPISYRVNPEKLAKRSAVEILDEIPGVAKKRKFDVDEELSEEKSIQSGATGENEQIRLRHVAQQHLEEGPCKARLSTDSGEYLTMTRVHENSDRIHKELGKSCSERTSKHSQISHTEAKSTSGELNPPAPGGGDGELHTKCYFRGNIEGRQAVCHRCFVSTFECCLSKLSFGQEENFWYCLACAATMAQEILRRAEDDEKKAKDAVRNAEEQLLAIQTSLAASLSARRELSGEQPKADNVSAVFNKEAFRGKVTETTNNTKQLLHAEEVPPGGILSDPEGEDMAIIVRKGTIAAMRGPSSFPNLQNFMEEDAASHIHERKQMQTVRQEAVVSEGLCAAGGNDVPDPDFPREVNDEEGPTSAPSLPVTEVLARRVKHTFDPDFPREVNDEEGPTSAPSLPVTQVLARRVKHTSGYCANEQSGSSGSSKSRGHPISISSPIKFRPHDGVCADVRARNGSEVSMSHCGDSIRSSDPLSIRSSREGEEGDGHDGDLEICEESVVAAEGTNVADKGAGLVSKRLLEASNVGAKSRRPQVYRDGKRNLYCKCGIYRMLCSRGRNHLFHGEDADGLRGYVSRGRKQVPGVRRQNIPWTAIEEDILKEGVSMFSNNGEWGFRWREMLDFGVGKFHESRTTIDLKDKWRNMLKALSKQSS